MNVLGHVFNYAFFNSSSADIEDIYKTEDIYGIDGKFCKKYGKSEPIRVYYVSALLTIFSRSEIHLYVPCFQLLIASGGASRLP